MNKQPSGVFSALLKDAARLPASAHFDGEPEAALLEMKANAVTLSNNCGGKLAGVPCGIVYGPNGSVIVCTCDGQGHCLPPS